MEISEEMEEKHELIDETKTQRTFLIKKVISAQRLALDRCNFSYRFALEKGWVKFVAHTKMMMRGTLGGAAGAQMDEIEVLKQKMLDLEEGNNLLSEENESLKSGAGQSVELIRSTGEQTTQIELITNQLGDKAAEITKLLAENKKLTK